MGAVRIIVSDVAAVANLVKHFCKGNFCPTLAGSFFFPSRKKEFSIYAHLVEYPTKFGNK